MTRKIRDARNINQEPGINLMPVAWFIVVMELHMITFHGLGYRKKAIEHAHFDCLQKPKDRALFARFTV
jgi:hypothetical protein